MGRNIEKRRQAIYDMVNQLGTVSFARLKEYFPDVSEVTLRKDLQYLDETQQIIRTHSGAKAMSQAVNFEYRFSIHMPEKRVIAKKAAELIQPDTSVFITAGSTCAELAKSLPDIPLYVFTDGLYTALNFKGKQNLTVRISGGEADMNTMRIEGLTVLESLDGMHFNSAFIGAPGFHPDYGFSYLSEMTAAVIKKVIECSDSVVMLLDSSKLNYLLTPQIVPLDKIDILVTDGMMEKNVAEKIEKSGIRLL